jgi:Zn-dependent peptidase ImmA (M78 family)
MLNPRGEKIEEKTREIITQVLGHPENLTPPLDLAKILKHFGISLELTKFKQPGVSGAWDSDKKIIYLSLDDSPKRQIFTASHELGHLILSHRKKYDVFYRHQSSEFNSEDLKDEKEANFFAACLLMPKELVQKFWRDKPDLDLLAAYFGVSKEAAFWRLKEMELE